MRKIRIYITIIIIYCNFCPIFSVIAGERAVTFDRELLIIHTSHGERTYDTEIATTGEQREHGLMYRKTLPENEAMLFVFPQEQKVNMWMQNTLIPLDMLFIDKMGKIIYIARNTLPESQEIISAGNVPVRAVLEVKAGTAQKHLINIDDRVIYKVFKE